MKVRSQKLPQIRDAGATRCAEVSREKRNAAEYGAASDSLSLTKSWVWQDPSTQEGFSWMSLSD